MMSRSDMKMLLIKALILLQKISLWSGPAMQEPKWILPFVNFKCKHWRHYISVETSSLLKRRRATGSGKSTCFQLPALMLNDEEFCLVIVPTVALGWDHLKACEDLGLSATYFSYISFQQQYSGSCLSIQLCLKYFLWSNCNNLLLSLHIKHCRASIKNTCGILVNSMLLLGIGKMMLFEQIEIPFYYWDSLSSIWSIFSGQEAEGLNL